MERAIAETNRRREKQTAYNLAHGITPESVRKNVADVLASLYEQDHVTVAAGVAEEGKPLIGDNLKAPRAAWRRRCARPPRTWSSRRPPACATRSSAWRPSSPSPTTPSPASPPSRPRRRLRRRAQVWRRAKGKGSDPSRSRSDKGRNAGGEGSDPRTTSRIQRDYQPVQPTFAQTSAVPGTRARKPSFDDMGSRANHPIPARDPKVDPRTKAGAYGEQVKGPHKPTLDEMGPHAERGLPVDRGAAPSPPTPRLESGGSREGSDPLREKKKHRHGRPRKTGRPGR